MSSKLLTFITYLLLVFFILSPAFSEALELDNKAQIMMLYSQDESKISHIEVIRDDSFILDKATDISVKGFIKPVLIKGNAIYRIKELATNRKKIFCRKYFCSDDLFYDFTKNPLSLDDFSTLRFVWNQTGTEKYPIIHLEAEIIFEDDTQDGFEIKSMYNGNVRENYTVNKTVSVENNKHVKMNYLYLLKREIGLNSDEAWRYREIEGKTILQSRIDTPLINAQSVTILMNPNTPFEHIQFSVDTNGNGARDNFIFSGNTKTSKKVYNGVLSHTVNLKNAINAMEGDSENATLMEVIMFLDDNVNQYLAKKPIYELHFSSQLEDIYENEIIPDAFLKGESCVLDFDLSQSVLKTHKSKAQVKNISVSIQLDGPQVINLERIMLYSMVDQNIPLIAVEPEKEFQKWDRLPTLNPLMQVSSFKPLMWGSQKKVYNQNRSLFSQYSNKDYSDSDIDIDSYAQWYRVSKNDNTLRLKGFFSEINSYLKFKIQMPSHECILDFKGNNIKSIGSSNNSMFGRLISSWLLPTFEDKEPRNQLIPFLEFEPLEYSWPLSMNVYSINGEKVDLPLHLFLRGGKLYPPKNSEVSFIIRPEMKKNVKESQSIFRDWSVEIQSNDKIFSKNNILNTKFQINESMHHWISSDPNVKNRLWPIILGANRALATLNIEQNSVAKEIRYLIDNQSKRFLPIEGSTKLLGLGNLKPISQIGKSDEFTIGLMDVKVSNIDQNYNYGEQEWWQKEAEISLIPNDSNTQIDSNRGLTYLFKEHYEEGEWIFIFPDVEFIAPLQLSLPESMPVDSSITLFINDEEVSIPEDKKEWRFSNKNFSAKKFALHIKNWTNESIIPIKTPKVKVFGLKRSAHEELKDLSLILDNRALSLSENALPDKDGNWFDYGTIRLEKGRHKINFINNPFFSFNAILLEAKSPVSLTLKEKDVSKTIKQENILPYKMMGILFFFLILYALFRFKKITINLYLYFRNYYTKFFKNNVIILNINKISILLLLLSTFFYTLSLFHKTNGINNFAAMGSVLMALYIWCMSISLKESCFLKKYPVLYTFIYKHENSPMLAWTIILIGIIALFRSIKLVFIAEQIGAMVYFILAVVIPIQTFKYMRSQKNTK